MLGQSGVQLAPFLLVTQFSVDAHHRSRRSAAGKVDQVRRMMQFWSASGERVALIRPRDEGQIDDEVLRTLQRELDLEESLFGKLPKNRLGGHLIRRS